MATHSLADKLTGKSRFLSYKFYAAIGALGLCLIFISIALIYCLLKRRPRKKAIRVKHASGLIPLVSKEIIQLNVSDLEVNDCEKVNQLEVRKSEESATTKQTLEGSLSSASSLSVMSSEVDNIAWGRWYSLRELNVATDGFASDNVVGEGGYGVVYRGYLADGSVVAVKKLLNNKGQAEKEFKVEVEAIGKVRHKNLVNLIGYCVEGVHRMLVYEYIDNGNLEQWLHGNVGPISPLTWDIRMRIAAGTAKGLAYLHEGLEPKVIHRDIKSSNILLDKKWNARVSDFGLAKLLEPETSHVTTRVMGTFGYVSPEYASTGLLCEGSDIYSFGVLLMEIISGRIPIDHSRPQGEVNLVNWFRGMIANRRGEEVVDPLLETQPSSRALKRALLVCLRCIDLDATKRPKMSQIVHMLEADEFSYHSEYRARRKSVDTCVLPEVVSKVPLMAQDSEVNRI